MRVGINTFYVPTVLDMLKEEYQGPDLESIQVGEDNQWDIVLVFKDDMLYRDVACWLGHARALCLINGENVER